MQSFQMLSVRHRFDESVAPDASPNKHARIHYIDTYYINMYIESTSWHRQQPNHEGHGNPPSSRREHDADGGVCGGKKNVDGAPEVVQRVEKTDSDTSPSSWINAWGSLH